VSLVLPTIIYIGWTDISDFHTELKKIEGVEKLYFSVVTFTTLGYGEIAPKGWVRLVASIQALMGPICVGYFIYAFGKTVAEREQDKVNTESESRKLQQRMDSFDKRQGYYRDLFRCYSQLFDNLNLQGNAQGGSKEVWFSHTQDLSASVTHTKYYDFNDNMDLVKKFYYQLVGTRNININEAYKSGLDLTVNARFHWTLNVSDVRSAGQRLLANASARTFVIGFQATSFFIPRGGSTDVRS